MPLAGLLAFLAAPAWSVAGEAPGRQLAAASGAAYYVDARSGDDGADGRSPDSAWRSLDRVNGASLEPGDRVLFRRGAVFHGTLVVGASGEPRRPIVFGAYGSGSKPVIDSGGADYGVVIEGRSYITVEDLKIVDNLKQAVRIYQGRSRQSGITVQRNEIQSASSTIYQSTDNGSATDIVIRDNHLTPGYSNYGSSEAQQWGVYLSKNVDGFEISGNKVDPAGEDAIVVWLSRNGLIAGNSGSHNGENTVDVKDSSGITIRGNTARNDREYGIIVHQPLHTGLTHDMVVEDNTVIGCGVGGTLTYGIAVWDAANSRVTGNQILDSYGGGLFLRGESGLTVTGNRIAGFQHQTKESALYVEAVRQSVIQENVVAGQIRYAK